MGVKINTAFYLEKKQLKQKGVNHTQSSSIHFSLHFARDSFNGMEFS